MNGANNTGVLLAYEDCQDQLHGFDECEEACSEIGIGKEHKGLVLEDRQLLLSLSRPSKNDSSLFLNNGR